ncbi:hypothetical protein VI06_10540 [Aquitalea magnusonii]|nr:hypothetical protein VI06_10540 [Aquitalea magnusonii]
MNSETDLDREIRNKTIATAATPTEKAAFERFYQSKGMRPSQMLQLMLSRVCPGEIEPGDLPEKVAKETPLFLRLPQGEAKEVRQRSKREGTTQQGWARKLIRTTLRRAPQFTCVEENALLQSNRELAHLGRNVNQIAHQLNISLSASDQMTAQRLEILVLRNCIPTAHLIASSLRAHDHSHCTLVA